MLAKDEDHVENNNIYKYLYSYFSCIYFSFRSQSQLLEAKL